MLLEPNHTDSGTTAGAETTLQTLSVAKHRPTEHEAKDWRPVEIAPGALYGCLCHRSPISADSQFTRTDSIPEP